MSIVSVLPVLAGILFIVFGLFVINSDTKRRKGVWVFPAGLSLLFLVFSFVAVALEGPTGFWPNHASNLWGNQVWFDLLLAIGIGWVFILPKARALGMNVSVWFVLIACSGSIGFLAMAARMCWLQEQSIQPELDI